MPMDGTVAIPLFLWANEENDVRVITDCRFNVGLYSHVTPAKDSDWAVLARTGE